MRSEFDPKRRAISVGAALALLGFPTITLSGCGGGGGYGGPTSPNPTPTPSSGDVQGTVSANHGHSAVITAAQLQAGNGLSLDIRGSAPHSHGVELTVAEVVQIRDRQRVSKDTSESDGGSAYGGSHHHTVTFN